ncbi:Nif3-like dinuclear metal center hexameric protein [Ureaplasma urealyticum]|nr:Nif3-like dinuclear metal center hexameric protein [Ureaplasma urealyticum]
MKKTDIKAQDILDFLTKKYDLSRAESWDRNGLFFDEQQIINNIQIALDITDDVVNDAILNNANLIISHHPLFTNQDLNDELDYFVNNDLIEKIKKNKISVIHLHTAFDASPYGMSMQMAKRLGLLNIKQDDQNPYLVVGELKLGVSVDYISRIIKQKFLSPIVKYNNIFRLETNLKKIGIIGGSGYKFADDAFVRHELDMLITSDLKYHNWLDAQAKNQNIIDINHLSESIFIDVIYDELTKFYGNDENVNKSLAIIKINHI